MTKKTVSIVIPTFNRADFVAKTVDCALAQTYPCQIIVCDHGSKDNTPQVLKRYGDKIKYIRRETDFGPHFCWLEGILNAEGEYVHLQYDDDLIAPDFIEKTIALTGPDTGVVVSGALVKDIEKDIVLNDNPFGFAGRFKTGVYDIKELEGFLLGGSMISPAACLYRRKDFIDALYQGDLPLDFGGNYHGVGPDHFVTLLAVLRYKKFGVVAEPLAVFGSHEGSITVDAINNAGKLRKLENGYRAVRAYYRLLRLFRDDTSVRAAALGVKKSRFPLLKKCKDKLKIFLKAAGLRKKEVR